MDAFHIFDDYSSPIEESSSEESDYILENNLHIKNTMYTEKESETGFDQSNYIQSLEQLKRSILTNSKDNSPTSIQKILNENVNSLQNSISLFYKMHKSQIDDINRVAEEYYFALDQLIRQNELITQNKNKVQAELESIESVHSQLIQAAASIHDSANSIDMNPTEKYHYLLNHNIIKYEKKCQKMSFKTKEIKSRIKHLKSQSIQNKIQIQFLLQMQNNLNCNLEEITDQVNQIIEFKNIHFTKLNLLKKTKKLISQIQILLIQNKVKKDSLLINEKLLLQKLNQLKEKEIIVNNQTKELNKIEKKIEQKKEYIKRTMMIKDDVEKPLLLVYNEIKDNIQEELQKELILSQQIDLLNANKNILNSNNVIFNEVQINSMKKQLSDLDNDCTLLRDEIVNQSKTNFKLFNQIKLLENEKNIQIDKNFKLNSHHNGNVAVLFDYAINRYDLDYITKIQKQINEKKENLKNRKEKYLKKCDALITVIENFAKKNYLDQ